MWMLCSRQRARFAGGVRTMRGQHQKQNGKSDAARGARLQSGLECATSSHVRPRVTGSLKSQNPAAASFRTAATWLTHSYRDGLMRTLRPRLPSRRSDTLRREYGEKRPRKSRGFRSGSPTKDPKIGREIAKFHAESA